MKRKFIALICTVVFICSGAVSVYATTSEDSPRENREVRKSSNRANTSAQGKVKEKSDRQSPRNDKSKSNSGSKSRFNSNSNNNWRSR